MSPPGGRGFAARVKPRVACSGKRVLGFLQECLISLGTVWAHLPMSVPPPHRPPPELDAPPEGHPERLCPHEPMSAVETDIWAGFYTDS